MSDKKANNTINLQALKDLIDGEQSRQVIADKIGCDVSLITKHYNGDRIVTIDYLKKYAEYFKVSADYLIDLSKAKTTDKDLKYICNYTGLSEDTIEFFHYNATNKDGELEPLVSLIELFISDYGINLPYDLDNIRELTTILCDKYGSVEDIINNNDISQDDKIQQIGHLKESTEKLETQINGDKYCTIKYFMDLLDKFSVSNIEGLDYYEYQIRYAAFIKSIVQWAQNSKTITSEEEEYIKQIKEGVNNE